VRPYFQSLTALNPPHSQNSGHWLSVPEGRDPGLRGKYAKHYHAGTNLVLFDPDTLARGVGEPQNWADFINEGGSGRKKCLRTAAEKRQLRALGFSGDVKLTPSVVRAGTQH